MDNIIIHNDPLPDGKSGGGRESSERYQALKRLEPGQCFYVTYTKEMYNTLSSQAAYVKKGTTKKFSIRKLHKDGENIIGIWRTA